MNMKNLTQKEIAENWIRKSKHYVRLSQIAFVLTSVLGAIVMIVSIKYGNILTYALGGTLIILSLIWKITELKWKDKENEWTYRLIETQSKT